MHKPLIISVVGAGGKTTHIHRLAEKYLKQGKKVLVITTTHMYLEKDTILELENDMETSVGRMKDALVQGFCMAGSPCEEERKMGPLSDHVTEQILPAADVVLVEADGAKHRLIKYPDSTEPVIYPGSSEIHIVMGMAAAGKKCRDVAHRTEKVMQCLGIKEDTVIREEDIRTLVRYGYQEPLSSRYPDAVIRFVPGVCENLWQRVMGECIRENVDFSIVRPEWFYTRPHLFICGCGHVAGKVAVMGQFLDFQVTVMDDREEFANKKLFPKDCEVICDSFENLTHYLEECKGESTYYVVVTRGHKADRQCVEQILKRNYAYLGMIGSKIKVAKTLEILRNEGYTGEQTDSIHAPIGLKIGSQTPEEIAVSIAAEIIQEKNAKQISSMSAELSTVRETGVLCMITEKYGSAPRGIGSGMFVYREAGREKIIGSVGGGSVEHAAIAQALKLYDQGEAAVITEKEYNLSDREGGELGMICGGGVKIVFFPICS